MTQRMFLLSILFLLNSANPIFGGFFGDINNRAAQRGAQRRAAQKATEYRADRQAIMQEDAEVIMAMLECAGYCFKSTANLVTGKPKNGGEVAAGLFTIGTTIVACYAIYEHKNNSKRQNYEKNSLA